MPEVTEKLMEEYAQKIEKQAEKFYENYRDQMDLLDRSVLSKVRAITPYDYYALGKQLESFEIYKALCEEEGNLNQLGKIPNVAFDVIAVAYGASIIPVIASVQPIDEEQGTVYFKNLKADTTKGAHTANDSFVNPKSGQVVPRNYASNFVEGEVLIASTTGAQTNYTGTFAQVPVRAGSIRIDTSLSPAGSIYAIDGGDKGDGTGDLLGVGLSGSITYATGAYSIDFESDPGGGEQVTVNYQVNYEQASALPRIKHFMDSQTILARVYALEGSYGMLQSYGMRRRFGMIAEDELARDLVGEINAEIGGDIIRRLNANAVSSVTFTKATPSGVASFEHYQDFKIKLNDAEANLVGNAGRGTITGMIADRLTCAIISSLPGFVKLTDGNTLGAHIFGTLDGMVVVRVLDSNILPANTAILYWKGPSPFEAPVVYSPYMPLVVTSTIPNFDNALQNRRAAAVWAGVDVLVANFATKLTVA